MLALDCVIGSGGVLSHAPHRLQAALMMLEGFGLSGLTQITVDSIFMMPHLGVFSSVHPDAAAEIFAHDCIVNIAHAIAPVWRGSLGSDVATVLIDGKEVGVIKRGVVTHLPLKEHETHRITIKPLHSSVDIGKGRGVVLEKEITTGLYGLIFDGRNRPIELPDTKSARIEAQRSVYRALGLQIKEEI